MTHTLAAIMLVCASLTLAQTSDVDKAFADFQRSWVTPDKSAADKLISDDLVWISLRGRKLDKQEVLKTWGGRGGMQTLQDKKVRVYRDAAVITFSDGDVRRTIVWHKTQDGWQVVSFHTSPVQQ
jgi:Domain of unknown function (DUF4440)